MSRGFLYRPSPLTQRAVGQSLVGRNTVLLQRNLTRSVKCKIHYKSVLSYVCHCLLSLVDDFVTPALNGAVVTTFYVQPIFRTVNVAVRAVADRTSAVKMGDLL